MDVRVNEGDQTTTCYKYGTGIDCSSFCIIGNETIDNSGLRKHSVLLVREGNPLQKYRERKKQSNVITAEIKSKILENLCFNFNNIHKILDVNANLEQTCGKKKDQI